MHTPAASTRTDARKHQIATLICFPLAPCPRLSFQECSRDGIRVSALQLVLLKQDLLLFIAEQHFVAQTQRGVFNPWPPGGPQGWFWFGAVTKLLRTPRTKCCRGSGIPGRCTLTLVGNRPAPWWSARAISHPHQHLGPPTQLPLLPRHTPGGPRPGGPCAGCPTRYSHVVSGRLFVCRCAYVSPCQF